MACNTAIIFLLLSGPAYGLTVSELIGEWRSGTLIGPNTAGTTSACKSFSWVERTVTLAAVPLKPNLIRGQWQRKTSSVWLESDGARCRWGNEQVFSPTGDATYLYSLNGVLDDSTGMIRITTEFISCWGIQCPAMLPPETTSRLDQTFRVKDGALVDTGDVAGNMNRMKFIRTGDFIDEAMGCTPLADLAIRQLDQGQFDTVLNQSASQSWRDRLPAAQLARSWPENRTHTGEVLVRVPLLQSYASNPSSDTKSMDEYILLLRGVQTSIQLKLGELVVMKREGKQWKVDFIAYY